MFKAEKYTSWEVQQEGPRYIPCNKVVRNVLEKGIIEYHWFAFSVLRKSIRTTILGITEHSPIATGCYITSHQANNPTLHQRRCGSWHIMGPIGPSTYHTTQKHLGWFLKPQLRCQLGEKAHYQRCEIHKINNLFIIICLQ